MSTNNYVTPYFFTQPPPNYNLNNSWSYNWSAHPSQNVRSAQENRSPIAPPLPPGPPPPPPPPANPRTPSSHPPVTTPNLEQRSQTYYNSSNTQATYRTRRYNNITSGPYNSSSGQYALSSGQYTSPPGQYSSSSNQYGSPPGQYGHTPGQYSSNTSGMYNITSSANYARNFYNKRKIDCELDNLKKSSKKKKKPLSQNIPQRKDWSVMDAKRALMVEKEYNKRHRSQSLIIKFPDLELNRDIVSKFHSSIDSVHFQQPSTPRFCFVTLKESADPETVIKDLNKIPFGKGHLTAEFKKDREDEINIGPEDIDPLTLYVGNLAQEVTKDDMVNTYPRQKRIDIGYAKKMKYTRYAFVSFKNVDDSIEAFQKTHATQMYSKSLIVRFRRLNGTVGMPGEPKPQLPQRSDGGENDNGALVNSNCDHNSADLADHNDVHSHNQSDVETESCTNSTLAPWEMVDVSQWETDTDRSVDLSSVKQEPLEDSDYEEEDIKPPRQYSSPFMPGDLDMAFSRHRPKTIPEIKKEKDCEELSLSSSVGEEISDLTVADKTKPTRPTSPKPTDSGSAMERTANNESISDCSIIPPDKIKKEPDRTPSGNTYQALRSLHPVPLSKDSIPVEVKKEPSTVLEEISVEQHVPGLHFVSSNDKLLGKGAEDPFRIKSEPIDKDDENDGDKDDSSDDSDDFNFNNILSSIETRSKRLKKIRTSMP